MAWEGSRRSKARLSRTHELSAISVSLPSVRNQNKTKTCSDVDSVRRWVSRTLIEGLRPYGGVGRLKSLKSTIITDPLIPGYFGQFALGAQPRQDEDLIRH